MSIKFSNSLIYECPKCGSMSLKVILNSNQLPIHKTVGVCTDALDCGYARLQTDYEFDNPIKHEPAFIDFKKVNQSLNSYSDNYFVIFLNREFGSTLTKHAVQAYYIGTSFRQKGASIFWQLDSELRACEGLIWTVNPQSGRRSNRENAISIHKNVFKQGKRPEKCFFGEHLIKHYPEKRKIIVRDEIDAVIGSIVYPENLWLATTKHVEREFPRELWPGSEWFPKYGYEKLKCFSKKSTSVLGWPRQEVLPYSLTENGRGYDQR